MFLLTLHSATTFSFDNYFAPVYENAKNWNKNFAARDNNFYLLIAE